MTNFVLVAEPASDASTKARTESLFALLAHVGVFDERSTDGAGVEREKYDASKVLSVVPILPLCLDPSVKCNGPSVSLHRRPASGPLLLCLPKQASQARG